NPKPTGQLRIADCVADCTLIRRATGDQMAAHRRSDRRRRRSLRVGLRISGLRFYGGTASAPLGLLQNSMISTPSTPHTRVSISVEKASHFSHPNRRPEKQRLIAS